MINLCIINIEFRLCHVPDVKFPSDLSYFMITLSEVRM